MEAGTPAESSVCGPASNGHLASLIGTPDDGPARKVSAAGFSGIAINFVNFIDEFPLFRDEVLPRLERLGVHRGAPAR